MKPTDFDPDSNLEALVDCELKQLPLVPAPPAFAGKVLRILQERAQRPWWQGAWWEWPWAAKLAFLLLALGLAGAFSSGSVLLDESVIKYSGEVTERFAPTGGAWGALGTLWDALALLWRDAAQPRLLTWLLVVAGLYLICVAAGAAVVRTTVRRV
jgi:hypothetical protein